MDRIVKENLEGTKHWPDIWMKKYKKNGIETLTYEFKKETNSDE